VLFSLGNNHAGSYFPIALPATAILGDLLQSANESTRWVILAVLDDYLHSFGADSSFDLVVGSDGILFPIETMVRQEILRLRPLLEKIAHPDFPEGSLGGKEMAQQMVEELARS